MLYRQINTVPTSCRVFSDYQYFEKKADRNLKKPDNKSKDENLKIYGILC